MKREREREEKKIQKYSTSTLLRWYSREKEEEKVKEREKRNCQNSAGTLNGKKKEILRLREECFFDDCLRKMERKKRKQKKRKRKEEKGRKVGRFL